VAVAKKAKRRGKLSKAVEIASEINAAIGKPALRLASDEYFMPMKIPTGSLVMDRITGGGFTLGRHVEIFGDHAACKSFIVYRTMALSQQRGNLCALIDPEKTFQADWFDHLGGISEELLLYQPDEKWVAEDAVGVMMLLARRAQEEGAIEVISIDSVAALVTGEEMKKDPREDDRIASQARMMSRALRRITTVNKRTLFLWTNQERANIGLGAQFNPRVQSGGRALKYYATTRIEMRKAEKVKEEKQVSVKNKLQKKLVPYGNWIQVRSEKDKSTRPYLQSMFVFNSRKGEIDLPSEIITLGLEDGLIERSGNNFYYEDIDGMEHKGTEKRFAATIRENDDLCEELIEAIQDQTVQISRVGGDDG
jgi:recombination protein RecA